MIEGLLGGFFWGINTVVIGVALSMTPFARTEQVIFLAPFISTFIHDLFSSVWMFIYMAIKKQSGEFLQALKTKSGKVVVVAALLGGPVGMTGYVLSIKYIGAGYTAIISSMFPAVGAFLSYIFLKEKMRTDQIIGLAASVGGVIALGYTPGGSEVDNVVIGFIFALLCVFGWAAEAVVIAYGLRDAEITDDQALQIRQLTSATFYAIIILPLMQGWGITLDILSTTTSGIIVAAALFGTTSYLFYYKAINKIGATKAMALNITYSAWSIVFGFLLLGETVSLKEIIAGLVIISGSIVAGGDIRELLDFRKNKGLSS